MKLIAHRRLVLHDFYSDKDEVLLYKPGLIRTRVLSLEFPLEAMIIAVFVILVAVSANASVIGTNAILGSPLVGTGVVVGGSSHLAAPAIASLSALPVTAPLALSSPLNGLSAGVLQTSSLVAGHGLGVSALEVGGLVGAHGVPAHY